MPKTRTVELGDACAPSLANIDALAMAAFEALPAAFRTRCGDLLIRVEDFAEADVLREMGVDDPFELTGLYDGLELTAKSSDDAPSRPDAVYLYRRPILDEWADRGDVTLAELVAHVLIHEIGHHFGWSDDDIARIADWR